MKSLDFSTLFQNTATDRFLLNGLPFFHLQAARLKRRMQTGRPAPMKRREPMLWAVLWHWKTAPGLMCGQARTDTCAWMGKRCPQWHKLLMHPSRFGESVCAYARATCSSFAPIWCTQAPRTAYQISGSTAISMLRIFPAPPIERGWCIVMHTRRFER